MIIGGSSGPLFESIILRAAREVKVLPVPGGPWMMASFLVNIRFRADHWDASSFPIGWEGHRSRISYLFVTSSPVTSDNGVKSMDGAVFMYPGASMSAARLQICSFNGKLTNIR